MFPYNHPFSLVFYQTTYRNIRNPYAQLRIYLDKSLSFYSVLRKPAFLSSKECFNIFLSVLDRNILFLENIAFYYLLYLLFQKNLSFLEIYDILVIVNIYFHR